MPILPPNYHQIIHNFPHKTSKYSLKFSKLRQNYPNVGGGTACERQMNVKRTSREGQAIILPILVNLSINLARCQNPFINQYQGSKIDIRPSGSVICILLRITELRDHLKRTTEVSERAPTCGCSFRIFAWLMPMQLSVRGSIPTRCRAASSHHARHARK